MQKIIVSDTSCLILLQKTSTFFLDMEIDIIDKNRDNIRALCNKHKVNKLFVFGSVLTDDFKKSSDIDLVVDFSEVDIYDYADNYFNLKASLEKLLKRQIDLLEDKAINNPYLRDSIDSSKQLIYG